MQIWFSDRRRAFGRREHHRAFSVCDERFYTRRRAFGRRWHRRAFSVCDDCFRKCPRLGRISVFRHGRDAHATWHGRPARGLAEN